MSNITLIMTRSPLQEFTVGKRSGRWGKMIVVRGGKVLSGKIIGSISQPPKFSASVSGTAIKNLAKTENLFSAVSQGFKNSYVQLGNMGISLETVGGGVEVVTEFDTLERYRTDEDKEKLYVRLKPRPNSPYEIRMDQSKNVSELNKTGNCFRVLGHDSLNSRGVRAGILIHEAPKVSFLLGCIAPREINNRTLGYNREPSRRAMEFIFNLMGGFTLGKKAHLLVMDK